MWNIKLVLYVVAMVILTLFIAVKKPEMHKPVMITDKDYQFEEINIPPAQLQPSAVKVDVKPIKVEPKQIKVDKIPTQTKQIKVTPVKSEPKKVQSQPVVQKTEQKPQQIQQVKQPVVEKPVRTQPEQKEQVKQPQTITYRQPKQLTEQEEIIAWNKWLSRLQNQVMIDSKVMAPLGTVFRFSFTVDKYGNMSNVKVWSDNPAYTNYAVRIIKPVLMSYRNQPILNFPEGTKRIVKNFNGSFQISRVTKYSSPSDYNDYERVKR